MLSVYSCVNVFLTLSSLYTRLKQFKERLSEEEAVSKRVHGLPNY